jgi:hypothetical protein
MLAAVVNASLFHCCTERGQPATGVVVVVDPGLQGLGSCGKRHYAGVSWLECRGGHRCRKQKVKCILLCNVPSRD